MNSTIKKEWVICVFSYKEIPISPGSYVAEYYYEILEDFIKFNQKLSSPNK